MAKTYYNYKKREGLEPIDYAKHSKNLADSVTGVFDERQKVRDEIDKGIREAEKDIESVEMGDDGTLNERVISVASDQAEELRQQVNLMRNGITKPADFAKFKQNVLDGVADFKAGTDGINKNLLDAQARVDKGESSEAELALLQGRMRDTWLDKTRMFTDKSGKLMIIQTAKKGGRVKDVAGSETSMRNWKNQGMQVLARYDVQKETTAFAKTIGEDIRIDMAGGMTIDSALGKVFEDPLTGEKHTSLELIDTVVDSLTDAQISSIMVDEFGLTATQDASKKGEKGYVFYGPDPTAANKNSLVGMPSSDPANDQVKKARDFVKKSILAQFDYKETKRASKSESDSARKARETRTAGITKATSSINTLKELFTADTAPKRTAAMAGIKGLLGEKFLGMEMDANNENATLSYYEEIKGSDGKTSDVKKEVTIPFGGTFDNFVKSFGLILTGSDDINTYYADVITDPAISGLTANTTAGGSYKVNVIQPPEEPEEITPWADMAESIVLGDDYDSHEAVSADATSIAQSFIVDSKIANAEVVEDFANKTITLKLGNTVVATITKTGDNADDLQPRLVSALRTLHSKARSASSGGTINAEGVLVDANGVAIEQ
tara:strand:- start:23428 stop:25254 length:1827 start_codon:yes stop_codon:yes gene_type:complete